MNNDLTFFTNEEGRSLSDRFRKILRKNTRFFDVLVGYFRASGFYLLEDSLENVEKIRILVGINSDQEVFDMYEEYQTQIKEFNGSTSQAIKMYKTVLGKEFEDSEDSEEVENGVNKFLEYLKSGKLEIRMYTKSQIHAKIYIMKDFEDGIDKGRVITGSSNFSKAGLLDNLEFNVELKGSADLEYASSSFEKLWLESAEISQECIDTIENDTWIKSDITPYEMYVKFLYEYFKEEINDDLNDDEDERKIYLDNFRPLQYQKDAVKQAQRMLMKHNGVFISDVVGLGKTYMCALLAQKLDGRKLFLCPPVLVEYWRSVLEGFGVGGFHVESEGKLNKIIEEGYSQYKYVFVDESHRFRNEETESSSYLHDICYGKKVILISATPQNNYNKDIASQLYLFQPKTNSTIVGVRNLESFFAECRVRERQYEQGTKEHREAVKKNSEMIRDKILREVMIRRTRSEIQRVYAADLKKQKLVFPKVNEPQKLIYEFDENTEKVFEETLEEIKELTYARYKPMAYVKIDKLKPEHKSLLAGQENMGGFMKGIIVKRLESSKFAFEQTLSRFVKSYKDFIEMYEKGTVYISRKLNVQELLENDDIDRIEEAVENKEAYKFSSEDFREEFINNLLLDKLILTKLLNTWKNVKKDNKLEYFIEKLKNDKAINKSKLIIFTESKETALYLKENIEKSISESVIAFSGSMPESMRLTIRENFDPNYNKENQKNDYRILITTDVLAEGMNLHRSNIIINYDLPWNPTRIMQRVGRINRVGTKHDEIYIYNFFPTTQSNEEMELEENILNKLQMFHDILGDDAKYLTDEEEVSTHELFKRMNTYSEEQEGEVDSELSYLKVIRDIRDKDKELFSKIQKYPKKIKIGRKTNNDKGLITFFRKGYLKKFYITEENNKTEEISFETAIEMIKADKKEKSESIKRNYYELLKRNKEAFVESEKIEKELANKNITNKKGTSNEKNIIVALKNCIKLIELTEIERENINTLIGLLTEGRISKSLLKQGNKMLKDIIGTQGLLKFYKDFEKLVPKTYFEIKNTEETIYNKELKKEIVLSEYFE